MISYKSDRLILRRLKYFNIIPQFYRNIELVVLQNEETVADWSSQYIKKKINSIDPTKPFVLGLPTGRTPLLMYKNLIEFHKNHTLSFKNVITFSMDEYVRVPKQYIGTYHQYMYNNFFNHIDIDPKNVNILNGMAPDLKAECERFENKIKAVGGVNLFVGGIGHDGHVALNEPGSSLVSRTRLVTLTYDTLVANARFFGNKVELVPKQALTVGVGTVMDSKEVMIVITGLDKALALHRAIEHGLNHMWTVSAFQQHPNAIIVCDEEATMELQVKTVKYFKSLSNFYQSLIRPD